LLAAPFAYVGDKTKAAPRHRLDVAMIVVFAERLAQRKDMHIQIAFLDKSVRPDRAQNLFLRDEMPVPFDQQKQYLQRPRRERHGLAFAQQHTLSLMQPEMAEFITRDGIGVFHRAPLRRN
jgi:hypothetical protein